jgi:hypothetical protein
MGSQAPTDHEAPGRNREHLPPIEPLMTEIIGTLALAAHAYLAEEDGRTPDTAAAEIAIDVAGTAFERVKERLRPEERLAISQMLTETRLAFVRKRGL